MKRLVIFGATGPTGRLLLHQAIEEGYHVTAVARHPAAVETVYERLRVLSGDVFDASSVEQAIAEQDAVIAVFGVGYSFKPITIYSRGIENIVQTMQKKGVHRLVCVTSGGTSPHYDSNEGLFFGLLMKQFIGRTLYADMRRMEQIVMRSDLDWTIVRPARLIDISTVSRYRVEPGYVLPHGTQTGRADLADFLLKQGERRSHHQ